MISDNTTHSSLLTQLAVLMAPLIKTNLSAYELLSELTFVKHLSEKLVHFYLVSVEDGTRFWQLGAGYEVRTPSSEFQAPRSILDDDKVDNVF